MSVSLSLITNTGQNDFITSSLLWSNMVKCSTPSSADHFRTDLCGDHSMKAATTAQVTVQDTGRLLQGEFLIFLYINTLFLTLKKLLCTDMASQITAEMVSSPDSSSDLCCLYASKHLLPNWTNWPQLSYPSLHNTLLIMRKCGPGCWLIAVLSHVQCHTGLSSHVRSCQVIKYRHNEINQYTSQAYDFSGTL